MPLSVIVSDEGQTGADLLPATRHLIQGAEDVRYVTRDKIDEVVGDVVCESPPSEDMLTRLLSMMSPGAALSVLAPDPDVGQLRSAMILAGFASITSSSHDAQDQARTVVRGVKPEYGLGSSQPIKLISTQDKPAAVSDVWKLTDDDDVDIVDADELIDESDWSKPSSESLRVACGIDQPGGGKKKACKNCTCGLADQLMGNGLGEGQEEGVKASSCGNCYLGDAFRCSTCPYMGTPAFKPGEKVKLTDMQTAMDL